MHFRDELRQARADTFKDAEAFDQVLFAMERLGSFLAGKSGALKEFEPYLQCIANRSPLAEDVPKQLQNWHAPFNNLYDLVRVARNDAMHQGAFARHLTTHAVELCLILEDALMADVSRARDFMVTNPMCAQPWEPISAIRRTMLITAFSFLPVSMNSDAHQGWHLLSDLAIAKYLRGAPSSKARSERLVTSLEQAVKMDLQLTPAKTCYPTEDIVSVINLIAGHAGFPVLVIDNGRLQELRGLITPFDAL